MATMDSRISECPTKHSSINNNHNPPIDVSVRHKICLSALIVLLKTKSVM